MKLFIASIYDYDKKEIIIVMKEEELLYIR